MAVVKISVDFNMVSNCHNINSLQLAIVNHVLLQPILQ